MPLETATHIVSLVVTNPDGSDQKNTADDHIRLIKACLRRTFPLMDGAVSLSHAQLMLLNDVSVSVQAQINALRDGSATANNALYANSASFATNANNALSLGGFAAAAYARLAAANTFVASQNIGNGTSTIGLVINGQQASVSSEFLVINCATAGGHINRYIDFRRASSSFASFDGNGTNLNIVCSGTLQANGQTIWHAGNDGAGSGLNADLVDGYEASEAANGSTVAARTAAGYIYATYFNQSSSEAENPNVNSVFVSSGDGFLRKATLAYLGSLMQTRNITNKTGTQKTISSSAPSGGNDGDIWYQI